LALRGKKASKRGRNVEKVKNEECWVYFRREFIRSARVQEFRSSEVQEYRRMCCLHFSNQGSKFQV